MFTMSELFTSGLIADIMLVFMLIEGVVLIGFHFKTGRGLGPAEVFWLLLPGICLVLAMRAALAKASWAWIALAVSISLFAHLGDLRQRFSKK